jgi:hypothetical protein
VVPGHRQDALPRLELDRLGPDVRNIGTHGEVAAIADHPDGLRYAAGILNTYVDTLTMEHERLGAVSD